MGWSRLVAVVAAGVAAAGIVRVSLPRFAILRDLPFCETDDGCDVARPIRRATLFLALGEQDRPSYSLDPAEPAVV